MSYRRRPNVLLSQPLRLGVSRLSRAALATSVSMASLLALAASPAAAQQAGTLPGAQVLQGGRWTGAKLPTVAQGNNGLVMTIEQEQKKALLDWSRFDVAKNEEVVFKQQATDWIALNRIFDVKPSEIAGKITANGQVWLQNTNGIIFRNGAQINAHTILATALPITEEQLDKGLLSGEGIIRGTRADTLFSDLYPVPTIAVAPRPVEGLDPTSWLNPTARPVGGENPTVLDLIARAAIRQAVLRDQNYQGVDGDYLKGYTLGLLNYYDAAQGKTVYYVDYNYVSNGLGDVIESIVSQIDVSKLGDYNYDNFKDPQLFFNGISYQNKPATSALIPQALRDEVAAQIKAQFIDVYAARVATAQQTYNNYIANSRVIVEKGATLRAVSSDPASPGKIMLFGPNVSNAGRLEAHDGQVLIAAGEQIKLSAGQNYTNSVRGGLTANVSAVGVSDSRGSIPGLPYSSALAAVWDDLYLERADEVGMYATNTGEIVADRGSVSMIGANVEQKGSILVTNGVRQRSGSILLQASHGPRNRFGGALTLGENSITRITPDLSSLTGLAADTFAPGKILLAGKDILLDRNSELTSRSGEITIHANAYGSGASGGTSPDAPDDTWSDNGEDEGSFTMRAGARIDVSGLRDVERSVADNVFAVEVRSNEVSGSPKQRDGILVGETVYVDRRVGAGIVDWTGALSGEQRTASQMSTKGGKVQIRATEYAVVDDGATIDVSGGSTKYLEGQVKTTRLEDSSGRFHDISTADGNIKYVGLTETTRIEQGYVEGSDAGSVELLAASARLFGKLKGDVVVGERQQLAAIGLIKAPRMPVGAVGATLVTTAALPKAGSAVLHRGGPEYGAWASRHSIIMRDENAFTGDIWVELTDEDAKDYWEKQTLRLDPGLIGQDWSTYEGEQGEAIQFIEDDFFSGMGEVSLSFGSGHQSETIHSGASIRLQPGGGFTMAGEGGKLTVGNNVSVIAPSGTIAFGGGDGTVIGRGVLLSVAAPWVNDADAPAGTSLGYVDGGSISLLNAELTGPVTLDAGGGGWYKRLSPPTASGPGEFQLVAGKGGGIALGGSAMSLTALLDLADIDLGGLGGGGSLNLVAGGDVMIGVAGGTGAEGVEYLSDTLFDDIGAGSLTLTAGSIDIAQGAKLAFQTGVMSFDGSPIGIATGADLDAVTLSRQRTGGALALLAGRISVAQGALVQVNATGSVSLTGGEIDVAGTIRAQGGAISLRAGEGAGTVHLASTAVLDATGLVQTTKVPGGADGRGFWYDGRIVAGGSVVIDASNAAIDSGALIDVSGTKGLLTVNQPGRYTVVRVNEVIGSDAGSITLDLTGGNVLGTLRGNAGTIYNYAGTLHVTGGRDGTLLGSPGIYDVESILQNLQWSVAEPTPENPLSLVDFYRSNSYWQQELGFGPNAIEDLQFTSMAEFQDFMRAALAPLTLTRPEDVQGALYLDPTLTVSPALPAAGGGKFAVPDGYTPVDAAEFQNSIEFVLRAMAYGPNPDSLSRGSSLHIGATPLKDMKGFDTVSIAGNIKSEHAVELASQRVLNLTGVISGASDMRFTSRNINLGGVLQQGQVLDAAKTGTLTISGETVEFQSKFNVGGFEKVVIEARGDMRGGYGLNQQVVADTGPSTPGVLTTGALVLRAGQIYPTTDGKLEFASSQSIRIERAGASIAPLSAGGLMTFTAPLIEQAGTLRAPFGEIRLNATRVAQTDADGFPIYDDNGEPLFTPGRVELQSGSITSTAADGRTILYGTTFDGQSWYRPQRAEGDVELATPPEKRVSLTGDLIDVQSGAVIDVSGSGDVLGLEFVAGPLGQSNVLEGQGVYAIVPTYGTGVIAPIDPLYNPGQGVAAPGQGVSQDPNATGLSIGDAVWLAAFDGHQAGWYTLLPAEYALTPGGYRITLAEGLVPATATAQQVGDDSFAVLGRRGVLGTTIADQVQSTYRVERGTDVRNRSEYFETYGNSFFSSARFLEGLLRSGNPYNADPRLPTDGGFLTLAANTSLTLDGTILAAGQGGVQGTRGGVVDITSDNIVIAAPGTDVSDLPGYLVLDPNKLSNIAESLLIGGIRRQGAAGLEIVTGQLTREDPGEIRSPEKSVGAENVVIRTNAQNALTGTELLFAANQTVRVESGAVVRATGNGTDAANLAIAPSIPVYVTPWNQSDITPAEDRGGAFLRVSNLGDITVSRTNVISDAGDMIVEAGAILEATDSILLDATQNTLVGDGATIKAGAITAASGLISFGAVPEGTEGLLVSGGTLAGLGQASKLTLKSYSTFDFYGDVALNLTGAVVLDGAALVDRGDAPGTASITAGTLELRNSDAAAQDAIGSGGTLALKARNVVLGEGDFAIAYGATTIDAAERLIFAGQGDNLLDGPLTVRAAQITGDSGAGHEVRVDGAIQLLGNGATAALPAFVTAGALLDFIGDSVEIGGTIQAGSGTVRATATDGDVRLLTGAKIDVAGADVSFFEVQGFLPGGGVQLTSILGDVLVDSGASVNISGGQAGGDAGSLVLSAGRGSATLAGALEAKVASGYRGGSFALTTSTLADFGSLNALLNSSGFSRSRDFAILDGDVTLTGVTRVDALRIVTGTGDIRVASDARIGSDSAKGGSILLASGGNLVIADGAAFDVNAKGTNLRGGSVDLQVATGGSIDVGAAAINVAGTGTGVAGEVRLRAPQMGGDVGVSRWSATVTGGDTQLEAFRVYDLADADGNAANGHLAEIDTALQTSVIGDASAFMTANAANIRTRLNQTGNASFVIVPGIELRSAGDLDLVHNWNLNAARFEGRAGVLTLRAGGDLLINANLSDGFISATPTTDAIAPPAGYELGQPLPAAPADDLTNDRSWSFNLVAGADFGQTNVLSTLAGSDGNIEIGGIVRTGTGDINVAASGDLNYEDASYIRYQGSWTASAPAARITVPAGTPIFDGTVLKPTTYAVKTPDKILQNPVFPAGTVIPVGTILPAGTRMPDGRVVNYTQSLSTPITLTADWSVPGRVTVPQAPGRNTIYPELPAGTVLRRGTKLPAGTVLPDGTTLSADTVLAADLELIADTSFPGEVVISGKTLLGSELVWEMASNRSTDPTASVDRAIPVSIPGLGDVVVNVVVGGTGSSAITLADGRLLGSGLVEMVNGAIYTAGVEAAPVDGFTPPALAGYVNTNTTGYVLNPLYAEKGGDVSVNVGGSINGAGMLIENFRWLADNGGTAATTLYGYSYSGKDPDAPFNNVVQPNQNNFVGQTSLSLLVDRFVQGIGALGGGDVSIVSGGDVDNLLVALPTTVRVSGGRFAGDAKEVHYSGGGDLVMDVGRNLLGGIVMVSKGTGTIDVAGSVTGTAERTSSYLVRPANRNLANLTLVVDDGSIALQAGGDVVLRGITSSLGVAQEQPRWLGYTENTSARITSLGGDITILGQEYQYGVDILPSKTAFIATAGSVNFGRSDQHMARTIVDMWADTRLDILAQQNVNFWGTGGDYTGADLTIGWADSEWVARAINPGGGNLQPLFTSTITLDPVSGKWTFKQAGPGFGIDGANVHSGSSSYSRIYAAQGDIIGRSAASYDLNAQRAHGGAFTFGHETRVKAGGDVRLGEMIFLTHDGSDVPVIEAGGAIYLPNATLYGPGRLWVQAGDEIFMGRTAGEGIRAREAISSVATAAPLNGGSITMLAGIDQAPEYEAFFDYYLDPESIAEAPAWLRQYYVKDERGLAVSTDVVLKDGTTRATVYAIELINYMRGLNGDALIPTTVADETSGSRDVTRGKLAAAIDPAEYAAALAAFEALDPVLKQPLAVRILNAELKTAGREAVGRSDETDGRFERQGDPTRGYDALGRLFPGAQRKPGEALAAGEHSWTGDINMIVSQVRAESGGGIDLVAPGGSVQLASLSVANTNPGEAGIVTQRGGSVNAIVKGDYIVNQSRTMTADDGDIMIWSSFGNIDAGRGRKSSLSVPPVAFPIDAFGQTRVQLSGLPNGAGIATLDQVDGKQGGDVDLYAFNGIVNAGDAGIRASRDLFVGAIEIRGLDNITVGGLTNIDLTTDEGSVGALNLENFAQSAEDNALDRAFDMATVVEKLRTVRQTILTGSVVSFGTEGCEDSDTDGCRRNR
ncbi:filamentous haemagglutinin family protein [Sphingomonas hengshuiensis]|nr:filamentous haemagglutinin family protein [Sphingomonas hengshuiensis]